MSAESLQAIAGYCADLAGAYEAYGGGSHLWHYGIWEPGVRDTRAALFRSNEILTRTLALSAESEVLDVGCGVGGFAIWAARRFGARVTGISICRENLDEARKNAIAAGVARRCDFVLMDMNRMELPSERFDLVVNQESFCYAERPAAYLRSVARLLRPGGVWSCIDFGKPDRPLRRHARRTRDVFRGFHLRNLASMERTRRDLSRVNLVPEAILDLTRWTIPSARAVIRSASPSLVLRRIAGGVPRDRIERNREGHLAAGIAYSRGLIEGDFRHLFFRGRKSSGG